MFTTARREMDCQRHSKGKKIDREYQTINKLKRKERENMSLKVEVKKRKRDIVKKFTYESRVGFDDGILIQNKKEVAAILCKHMCLGCDKFPRHKTERSQHCKFHGVAKDELKNITS